MNFRGGTCVRWWCLCFVVCTVTACGSKAERKTFDQVNLQLKWVHQAQFAGFYTATEKGYYRDENIRVNYIEGGKDVDVLTSLVSGKAHFAVASSEIVLLERQKNAASVTAVAAIYRRSAVVYLAKSNAGISGPKDFIGRTVAIIGKTQSHGEFEYQFKALMKKEGVNINDIDLVVYDPDYTDFYSGKVDVTAAYYTGGVMKIRNKGYAITLIWPNDYGIHFYSDTLITTEEMINTQSDLTERFLRASLKGWRQAIADPKESVAVILKYARIKDQKLQQDMLTAMTPLVHTGQDQIGWMQADIWSQMYQVLVDQNIIESVPIDFEKVYTMRFLEKIYPNQKNTEMD